MLRNAKSNSGILDHSVQINDGLTQTSADGASLVFDSRYGIMFCIYMPGHHGSYGESRGRICLTYFPASQPTNSRTIEIASGHMEYVPQIVGLGDGKVRAIYEINSRDEGDHLLIYRDFDYLTGTLTDEQIVMLRREDGSLVPLTQSEEFAYLEDHGYFNHTHLKTEQIIAGGCTVFRGTDGLHYGAVSSYLSEVILYRSRDALATVEFFAICPQVAQYEFDYKFLNGTIYAIYRTNRPADSIAYTTSADNGVTWTEPVYLRESITCRPRMIVSNGHILFAYNYFNADTGNRPEIQQGRTSIRLHLGECVDPHESPVVADLYSKYGIVNIALADVLGDVYLAYSTSELALEYQNGNPRVRGKDSIRYVKLGELTAEKRQQGTHMNVRCVWEHNGNDTLIYAENAPGAFARGATREEAMAKLDGELRAWTRWQGKLPRDSYDFTIVQEQSCDLQVRDADSDVLFEREKAQILLTEYLELKELVLKSAEDFQRLYDSVPDKDASCLPERETFYGPVPRTAREMYEHTKNVNDYYFGEIGVDTDHEGSIAECRRRGFEALEQQPGYLENRIIEGSCGELWTLRKVLRRFLWHDRIHARAMYRMAVKTFGEEQVENVFSF